MKCLQCGRFHDTTKMIAVEPTPDDNNEPLWFCDWECVAKYATERAK